MTTFVGILFLALGAVSVIVGLLAATKRLPGNSVIGIRVAEVRKSQETWEKAHQAAGPMWIVAGVALLFGGLIAFRVAGWQWIIPILLLLLSIVFVALGANIGARRAAIVDIAQKIEEEESTPEAPKPALDLDAVKRAAEEADNDPLDPRGN